MAPVTTAGQVFDAIQKVKKDAPGFCANFFPLERKLQGWIDHAELLEEVRDGVVFFLRKDRGFLHLYFCAASRDALKRELSTLILLKEEPIVADLVGNEGALRDLSGLMESQGFQAYQKLYRMARMNPAASQPSGIAGAPVGYAARSDAPAILELLCRSFDRYAEQLPMHYEIEAAIDSRQILVAKSDGKLAGLLFYETQGFTSMVRYWLVDEPFRAFRFGSALMQRYFAVQPTVRRFLLWVLAGNENAVKKYQHYGYAADGLVDLVMANQIIHA